MKKLSLLLASVFASVTAHGATVNWSAQTDVGFASSNTAALTQGNYIRLGYFTISDAAVAALANPTVGNVAALDASFVQFGQAQVGDAFGLDGFFQSTANFSYASNPGFDNTKQAYMWVVKASNNATLGSALSSVTEQAIFYEPKGTDARWEFPATDIATKSPDVGNAKTSLGGVYLAGTFVASNAALTAINAGNPTGAVQLQAVIAVPEPSSLAVGLLTILTAASVRRRRK
jgi:hypothetical protein